MALTQMQIIQSLGEALNWFERELQWGVPSAELRHLSGRIGELYAALITNGQMATSINQEGYDVVSSNGERVSVKTTTIAGSSGHISFNPKYGISALTPDTNIPRIANTQIPTSIFSFSFIFFSSLINIKIVSI